MLSDPKYLKEFEIRKKTEITIVIYLLFNYLSDYNLPYEMILDIFKWSQLLDNDGKNFNKEVNSELNKIYLARATVFTEKYQSGFHSKSNESKVLVEKIDE